MPTVSMRSITKRYGSFVALDSVDFELEAGSVQALIGENGAGKTTLMKILYGLERPDSGSIELDGKRTSIPNPQVAIGLGIGMVQQRFKQVPSMSVLENITLGVEPQRFGITQPHKALERIKEYSDLLGLKVALDQPLGQLSIGVRQKIEILKLLYRQARILIFDEPTSVLTPQETEELFGIIEGLQQQKMTIVYISHKIWEILRISDRVTVLRKGVKQGSLPTKQAGGALLTQMMIGEDLRPLRREGGEAKEALLEVSHLSARSGGGKIKDLSLAVGKGEIVGIAGIEGSGQRELLEAVAGLLPPEQGQIFLEGQELASLSVQARRAQGIAYIPQDRDREGLCLDFSLSDNLIATHLRPPIANNGLFNLRTISQLAHTLIERYDIRTPSAATPARQLSGGNAQKVVLARELHQTPRLILASHPTRGVDIGAMRGIHQQLLELRQQGCGVLLDSSELDELFAVCDRLVVLREGQKVGEVQVGQTTPQAVGALMLGEVVGHG